RWEGNRGVPLMSQFADGRRMPAMWDRFLSVTKRPLREVPVNARVIETRRPVIVEDAGDASLTPPDWVEAFGLKSYMVVPIVRQDEVIGVVILDYCERARPFAPWQVDLAVAVVGHFPWLLEGWRQGRAVWSSDVPNDPRFDRGWVENLPAHSVLFVPTLARGEPVGGLFLVWWHTGRVFEPAEIRLVEGVAAQV